MFDNLLECYKQKLNENLFIHGNGGFGKTTQLQNLFRYMLNNYSYYGIVPVFIDSKQLEKTAEHPVFSYICRDYLGEDILESETVINYFVKQRDKCRYLIIIDAVNEASDELRIRIQSDITLLRKNDNIRFIVSSRIDEKKEAFKGFTRISFKNLDDKRIINYLKKKFTSSEAEIDIKKFSPSLIEILRTPLYISIFAKTYKGKKDFPELYSDKIARRADLLGAFVEKKLHNDLEDDNNSANPYLDETRFVIDCYLPALAFEVYIKGEMGFSAQSYKREIKPKLNAEYFDRFISPTDSILDRVFGTKFNPLAVIVRQLALMRENGADYEFTHQIFRDYFAACYIRRIIENPYNTEYGELELNLDEEVRRFVGELMGECDFEDKCDTASPMSPIETFMQENCETLNKHPKTIGNLIRIMKTSRNNRITAKYDNLDLKYVNFSDCDLPNSSFDKAKVYRYNFVPEGHTYPVICVAVTPDGKYIVSGSRDKTIRISDFETHQQIGEPLTGHEKAVTSVAVTTDGKYIVSGSDDDTIRIWDFETHQQIGEPLTGHEFDVNSVAVTTDGKYIVSGSWDKTIRIWDFETHQQVGEPLTGHEDAVTSVAIISDNEENKYIVSGSYDKTIRIWDFETHQQVGEPLTVHKGWVTSVAITTDGKYIVSGSRDNTIRIWDFETHQQVGEPLTGHKITVTSVAITSDGKYIVSGSADGTIRIWDFETHQQIGEPLTGHEGTVTSVAVTTDGKFIVSGSWDHTIRIWDFKTHQQIGEPLTGHKITVTSVAVTADGKYIVNGGEDGTIRIWDFETHQQIGEPLTGHKSTVTSVFVTPDGKNIVSGSWDGTIRNWDFKTHQQIGEPLSGHKSTVTSVAVTTHGKYIDNGGEDGTIRIWDFETHQQIGEPLTGHKENVTSLAVTTDGKYIVSGSNDGTIRIWDIANRTQRIAQPISSYIEGCDLRNAVFLGERPKQFWRLLYSNGAVVPDEYIPQPLGNGDTGYEN